MKFDAKRAFPQLYNPPADRVTLVEPPLLNQLVIDGQGDPNTAPAYHEALEALYALSYAVKFACKRQLDTDYVVPPLEGLWWTPDMAQFTTENKAAWHWTMMIMQPEPVSAALVATVLEETRRKKPLPALDRVRFAPFAEGPSAQILHIGPWDAEAPTIARLHAWIAEQGYALTGRHHEIYLGDPRRTAPEKLRTVLRQPVCRSEG